MRLRPLFLLVPVAILLTACSSESPEAAFRRRWKAAPAPAGIQIAGRQCEISRDASGLYHTRASDELGAYACLGYLHGRYRAFQADFFRRTAQGRSAEILGWKTFRTDFFLRLLGLAEVAEKQVAALPATDRALLDAYSEGMNEGIARALGAGSYEFQRFGYVPDPWRAADSAAVLLLQSFNETQRSIVQKMSEATQLEKHGESAPALFTHDGLPWDTTILKDGEFAAGSAAAVHIPTAPVPPQPVNPSLPIRSVGSGSNSWVLAPSKSKSGKAWLANDPHLDLVHPPFWLWVNLTGGDLDVVGATVPGTPLMPSGLNRHAAWGITDSYLDAGDIVSVPEASVSKLPTQRPHFKIKVGFFTVPFFFKTFRRTSEGWPVLPIDAPPGRALVFRWTALTLSGESFSGFSRWLKAKTVREIDDSFAHLHLPSWNFVFADDSGNIGYRAQGAVLRQTASPTFGVRPVETAELPWRNESYLSADQMPHAMNPKRGYVVTANNRQWPPGARFHGGRSYPHGFRAFRIEELLNQTPKHDLSSLEAIQCDTKSVEASFLVPRLLKAFDAAGARAEKRPPVVAALDELRRWDFDMKGECRACSLYQRWTDRLIEATGFDAGALYRALEKPEAVAAVPATLDQALEDLRVGPASPVPSWADLQRAFFPHVSRARVFENHNWISVPGGPNTVNPMESDWDKDHYVGKHGASERLIVELSSPPRAVFSLAGPNEDLEQKELSDDSGPWVRWRNCQHSPVAFPFAWENAKKETVTL